MSEIEEAQLGLASTEELIREIIARFTVQPSFSSIRNAVVLAEMLGGLSSVEREYRTVDS